MKKLIFLIALIPAMTGLALADTFFGNRELSDLRVVQTSAQDKTAVIKATAGDSAVVQIGDTISQSNAQIITIGDLFVVVKTAQGTTKMPVLRGGSIGDGRIGNH